MPGHRRWEILGPDIPRKLSRKRVCKKQPKINKQSLDYTIQISNIMPMRHEHKKVRLHERHAVPPEQATHSIQHCSHTVPHLPTKALTHSPPSSRILAVHNKHMRNKHPQQAMKSKRKRKIVISRSKDLELYTIR